MKIYFAHSFSETGRGPLAESDDPHVISFFEILQSASVEVCDPAETAVPEADFPGRYDYCISQIESVDALVVDATCRLGVGVGAEMMLAMKLGIPVYTICPSSSHYIRRSSAANKWIHPFIYGMSTKLFDSLEQCAFDLLTMSTNKEK